MQAIEFDARAVRAGCSQDASFGYAVLSRFMEVAAQRLHSTRARLLDARMDPPNAQRVRDVN